MCEKSAIFSKQRGIHDLLLGVKLRISQTHRPFHLSHSLILPKIQQKPQDRLTPQFLVTNHRQFRQTRPHHDLQIAD